MGPYVLGFNRLPDMLLLSIIQNTHAFKMTFLNLFSINVLGLKCLIVAGIYGNTKSLEITSPSKKVN